jgi:DNA-binding transcriptional MerR regulator
VDVDDNTRKRIIALYRDAELSLNGIKRVLGLSDDAIVRKVVLSEPGLMRTPTEGIIAFRRRCHRGAG